MNIDRADVRGVMRELKEISLGGMAMGVYLMPAGKLGIVLSTIPGRGARLIGCYDRRIKAADLIEDARAVAAEMCA